MRFWIAALSLAALLFSSEAALADKRVAFVVGNGAYVNVPKLPNPPIDAKLMASTLRNVGFDVVEGFNLTHDQMADKLVEFGHKAEDADIAVFYYAGHGIAVNDTNYLLPVDANLKTEQDLTLRGAAFSVQTTMDETLSSAKVKLVFLDACRDNPFAEQMHKATRGLKVDAGLAKMDNNAVGTLIAFATAPNKTALDGDKGTNSPFTRALVDNITQPGLEIQQAMTKVRAEVNDDTDKKQMPWGNTNLIGNVYLNPVAPTDNKAGDAKPDLQVNTAPAGGAASAMELEFWRSVKDSNKIEELNAYITKYPDGAFRPLALARIETIKEGGNPNVTRNLTADPSLSDSADQVSEDQIGLKSDQRRDVQRRLTKLGFDVRVTGKFDDATRDVIRRWQAARNYPATGYLNKAQHSALLSENVASRVPSDDEDSDASSSDGSSSHVHHYRERESHVRVYHRNSGPPNIFGGLMRLPFGR